MTKKLLNLFLIISMLLVFVPVVAAAPPAQGKGQDYVVVKDDWLSKLAEKYLGNVLAYPAIVEFTNQKAASDTSYTTIHNPNKIEVGWKIYIPSAEEAKSFLGTYETIGTREHPIKVLFVPSVEANVIVSGGKMMADALNKATGLYFDVKVPTSYAATIEEMCASPTDTMGFIPGLGYVLANARCGVDVAFKAVRFGNDWYAAEYVVARDGNIKSLKDLAGKKWAYPDAASASGFLYPSAQLQQEGVKVGESFAAGGHPQAVLAVLQGKADFATVFFSPPLKPQGEAAWAWGDAPDIPDDLVKDCAVSEDGAKLMCGDWRVLDARQAVRKDAPDVIQKVRILALTAKIPNDTLSFSPNFPYILRTRIFDALQAYSKTEEWNKSIGSQDFYGWTGIVPATDAEYEPIRQGIKATGFTLEDLGKK
jgi:phosphonate transport system substrate-binding protein